MDKRAIGERLRALRGAKSAETVAMAVGVTRAAIYNYENGERTPSDEIKVRLCDYFGVPVQTVFFAD